MSELPRLLCVDDEPELLASLKVSLRKHYRVTLADSGPEALALFQGAPAHKPPFDVVLSDMRMPRMSGAELLSELHRRHPDMPRLLLSGQADLESTIAAINDARIFRFLTKPCETPHLVGAIDDALEQARLVRAERELLDRTLNGTVGLLTEVLGLVSVGAHIRAQRIEAITLALSAALERPVPWDLALAAKLSQLGFVVLQDAAGADADIQQSEVAAELLARIPRMETVARLIRHQNDGAPVANGPDILQWSRHEASAEILRVAIRFDALTAQGVTAADAVRTLSLATPPPPRLVLKALSQIRLDSDALVEALVSARQLAMGMTLVDDVETADGLKLAVAGTTLTSAHIGRIRSFATRTELVEPIAVLVSETRMRKLDAEVALR